MRWKFGHFDQEQRNGDDQAQCLRLGARLHHLYMWQLFDHEHILPYTMARNSDEISMKRKQQDEIEKQYTE